MKTLLGALIISGLSFLLQGCTMNGTPVSALGTPHFVPQSQPDSAAETGIGQDPITGGIFLQWYTTAGAVGYKVFRSDSADVNGNPTDFTIVRDVSSFSSVNDTSMVDASSIVIGVRFYYYLKAYTSDGSMSSPSDTINYSLLNRPSLSYPKSNAVVQSAGLYFNWADHTGGGYTVIRVEDITTIPETYVWVSKKFQIYESYPTESFDFDSVATGSLISGHSYQWRVDRFNIGTNEGARSVWQTFTIN